MKKQKTKKKINKVDTRQRDVREKFIPHSNTESLDLAPQTPLGIESQSEFQTAELTKD